jgi:hypothetical protein
MQNVAAVAATPNGQGYWTVSSSGAVSNIGDAGYFGDLPNLGVYPNAPVVSIVPTESGLGYWLVGADGGIFAFGDAEAPDQALHPNDGAEIAAATSDGRSGLWGFGHGGGSLEFSVDEFPGEPNDATTSPIVGAASAEPGSPGCWIVSSDGGVFAEGGAPFYGSVPQLNVAPPSAIVGIAASPNGMGYWLVGADGGVFAFGDAKFAGSLPGDGIQPSAAVVGIVPG